MSLDEIGLRYGTDKASSHHGYLDIYEREIPRTPGGSLLELGWLDGASISMWHAWLPGWTVTGLDNEVKEGLPGTNFVLGEQDDLEIIEWTGQRYGPFDVVVDDASHEVVKTAASFALLWPHVRPGGLYFVEDLGTAFIPHWGGDQAGVAFNHLMRKFKEPEDAEQMSLWGDSLCMVRKAA
jgi:demethylmacrocin O-methyltransferase